MRFIVIIWVRIRVMVGARVRITIEFKIIFGIAVIVMVLVIVRSDINARFKLEYKLVTLIYSKIKSSIFL